MSDTTHEAPERIWAGNWLADLGQGSWDIGEWRNCDWPSEGYKTVEYVRADLVQAAVAAALREAAAHIAPHPYHDKADWTDLAWEHDRQAWRILTLAADPAEVAAIIKKAGR